MLCVRATIFHESLAPTLKIFLTKSKNNDIISYKKKKWRQEMTKEDKLARMENRLSVLKGNPKNVKCPGVIRKLSRQIRNMK